MLDIYALMTRSYSYSKFLVLIDYVLNWVYMIQTKMIQTKGYAAHQAKAPLRQISFERRDPRNHDIVIDIQYCGICHTDVHQVKDERGGSTFPMVPGHEIVGIVTKVGCKRITL